MSEYVVDESAIFETPLLELDLDIESDADVYAKAEWFNLYDAPHGGGSVKSRIAKGMLDGAEERGDLDPGVTVIEPTSGNTGSEVARLAGARGYDVEIVMPDNAAGGKVEAVRDAGAEIHFVDADLGYDAVIERCEEIVAAVDQVDLLEVMTSDTHVVNTVEAENQVGDGIPSAELIELIDELVDTALEDLEPVEAGMASEQTRVTVFGTDRTETLASTANAVVSMGGALAAVIILVAMAVSVLIFFLT